MSKKTFYITTPIYYPSGELHIGHLYSTTLAWTIRNYKKKMGYDTKFVTGSDEHGQKIEKKALESKMTPQAYVDIQTNKFIDFWKLTKIDYDFFSKTTNDNHKNIVENIFNKMLEKQLIYKDRYKGLYSYNDEEFVPKNQAIKKGDDFFHPTSMHKLEEIEEESYFFRTSKFASWLIEYVEQNKNFVIPHHIWNELKKNFLEKNLEDLSITRTSFQWGIKVQKDPQHVIYVWLDALFNYLTILGFNFENENENYKKYWKEGDEIVHVIGKEITRFHCIYWPIFLKSLDLKLPNTILSHGWIVTPEGKMSKSKGNVINPLDLLKKFDIEIIKYYLMAKISIYNDGIFSEELLINTYNSELVNIVGNLISRTVSMINQNFQSPVKFTNNLTKDEQDVYAKIKNSFNLYKKHLDLFEVDLGINSIIELGRDLNKYIDITMPWKLNNDLPRLEVVLNTLLNGIFAILSMIEIVIPDYVNEFKKILNINSFDFELIFDFDKFDNIVIGKNMIVFPRVK